MTSFGHLFPRLQWNLWFQVLTRPPGCQSEQVSLHALLLRLTAFELTSKGTQLPLLDLELLSCNRGHGCPYQFLERPGS